MGGGGGGGQIERGIGKQGERKEKEYIESLKF